MRRFKPARRAKGDVRPDGWIAFLNQEAEELQKLAPSLPRGALRGHIRDRLLDTYRFPLQTIVRVLVVGERHLPALPASDGRMVVVTREQRFLELWPEGLTREAAGLTGPILIPCARPLGPGSVLTVALSIDDPTRHELTVPGLLARAADFTVEVAVEP